MVRKISQNQSGSIIVSILVISILLTTFIFALLVLGNQNIARSKQRFLLLQAQYTAESGADTAIAMLNSGAAYTGTGGADITLLSNSLYKATYSVTVAAGGSAKEKIITATGKLYTPITAASPTYTRTIEVITQRSSATYTSGATARNIIYIDSGVKNIQAKDVYANSFIVMNKNTTNLIAENITVADKNTGASNCSIGGTGNLVKPSSFTTPGQTKTNITTAYNNCITPPGNTSNTNFNVAANQINVTKIATTYIPWSQYMDSTYQNANSCNDLTTGSFPRNLPGVSGSKATHYPDSGSGISLSCGLAGDLGDLGLGNGQYNINDNVHIRANLCLLVACDVTFNNPSPTLRWVFVEGSVNFSSLHTEDGSGPIALVVYGSDPATKILVCPYGGAAYLGNNNSSAAPALYIVAMNGVCIDKTKFSASPALGGLSGKNLYIASNPGTPFDLKLDPSFPYSQIPTDLSWRAIRYRRI